MNKQKGFTIIEVIVVIVIVLALEAIVWASLARYDNKGKNSAIKGNLYTLAMRGTAYFEKNGSYNGFCESDFGGKPIKEEIVDVKVGGTFICNYDEVFSKWCACSKLIATSDVAPNTVFCVDSSGVKKQVEGITCDMECPAAGSCR